MAVAFWLVAQSGHDRLWQRGFLQHAAPSPPQAATMGPEEPEQSSSPIPRKQGENEPRAFPRDGPHQGRKMPPAVGWQHRQRPLPKSHTASRVGNGIQILIAAVKNHCTE